MSEDHVQKLLEMIGEKNLLKICELFPNERLPGRKFKYRWLFQKFRRDWEKCTQTNEKHFAKKFNVNVQTIYNWIKKIRAQKRQSLIQQLTKGVRAHD